jgi:hypothetical protein
VHILVLLVGALLTAQAVLSPTPVAVRVVPLGALPFSVADLEEAIAERQLESASRNPSGDLVVRAVGPHTIELAFGRKRCLVDIDDDEQESAVRLVALNAVDLFLAEPAPIAPLVKRERVRVAGSTRTPPATRARFAVVPELGHGLGSSEASTYAVAARASLVFPSGLLYGSVGWWQSGVDVQDGRPSVAMHGLPVRLGGGLALGPAEVGLALLAVPYQLTEATQHSGVLLGGSANATLPFTLGDGVRVFVSVGIDAFASRIAVRLADGQVPFASPRFLPWVGLGLGWETTL